MQKYGDKETEIWDGRLVVYEENKPIVAYVVFGGPRHPVKPTGEPVANPTRPGCWILGAPEAVVTPDTADHGCWIDAFAPTGAILEREGDVIHAKFQRSGIDKDIIVNRTRWFKKKVKDARDSADVRRRVAERHNIPELVPQNVRDRQIDELIESRLLDFVMESPYCAGFWEGDPKYADDMKYISAVKYVDNPFGPWAFRLNFPDGRRGQQVLHTTADNFIHFINSGTRGEHLYDLLGTSHGCIHIAWADLKELIENGWAKKGRLIITYPYGKAAPDVNVLPYS